MKLRFRVLSVCLIVSFLVMACGNATEKVNTESVSVQEEDTNAVCTIAEEPEVASIEEVVLDVVFAQEDSQIAEWSNCIMPNVEESLSVRKEADAEADLAGKLRKGDRATVLEIGEEWTKIESGELVGYVKNEYCIYGVDALVYARENCDTIATATTDGLRVREEMNVDSKIVDCLEEGDTIVVDINAEVEEGWVAVKCKEETCYVSEEFVTVSLKIGTGITMEEIEEQRRAEEAAKAAAEKAKKEAAEKKAEQDASVANVDDLTLMAAIIYCEAGAECYDTQLAVGAVIMNRVRSGRFPNTLYGVIYQKGQFGPARSGKLARVIAKGNTPSSCYQAAQAAMAGSDNTGGCLFFNDYNGSREGLIIGGMVFW